MELYSNIIGEESGKPMLILHGLFGMGDNWKTIGKRFADEEDFQVHLVDQRNHGRSPHTDEWSYEVMANDIKDYCKQHHLEKIVLLGHSMGGKTAMEFAVNNPELLEALIVVDIAPKSYPPHHDTILEGLNYLYNKNLTSRKEADEKLAEFIDELGVRQFLLKNLYRVEKTKLGFRMNLPVITEKYDAVSQSIAKDAEFAGPTFFVKGEKSGYIKEDDRELLNKHFPKSQLLTIKGAGHWVHAEKPDEFYQGVISFLKFNGVCP